MNIASIRAKLLSVSSAPISNLIATSTGILPCENSLKAFVSLDGFFLSFCTADSPANSFIVADMSQNDICISLAISRIVLPC